MPVVMHVKYTVSSNGDLTGFLNLTIDKAPTIPNDNAIFPEITFVTKNVITGKKTIVTVWVKVVIQLCLHNSKTNLIIKLKVIKDKTDITGSIKSFIVEYLSFIFNKIQK